MLWTVLAVGGSLLWLAWATRDHSSNRIDTRSRMVNRDPHWR
jgi:hypothetical protein